VRQLLEGTAAVVPARSTSPFVLNALHRAQRLRLDPLAGLFDWFEQRFTRPAAGRALDYLAAYGEVLFFEMNRPYEPWFERRVTMNVSDRSLEAVLALDGLLTTTVPRPFSSEELRAYLEEAGISTARIADAEKGAHLTDPAV